MFIYVIKSGDSIYTIAQRFKVSVQSIQNANNIDKDQTLVVGQAIVIPDVAIGYREKHGTIETNGFIIPSTPEHEAQVLSGVIDALTYITPFSHHVNADGSLTTLNDTNIKNIAARNNTAVMLSVTNIGADNFDTKLIDQILNNQYIARTLIDNIRKTLDSGNYRGVTVDFEKISPINRNKYNDFLDRLSAAIKPKYLLAVALAPKTYDVRTGAWHGAHDYKAIGSIADFVIIMTYEWGWSGGPPMAVAPITEVEKVINYAITVIPPRKIMMGMPLYGYDWTLPYVPGGEFAESIGNDEAVKRAVQVNARIQYDSRSKAPFYEYYDKQGRHHQVWFEDARSVLAKYELVVNKGLRGVSYWVLSMPFVQNFEVLKSIFDIKKLG